METREVAEAVEQTKTNQEIVVMKQAQHLAKLMVAEIVKELKP
jgi:hypothetical protein